MAIQRLRCEWTGTGIEGPGLTTFFAEADGTKSISVGAAALFETIKAQLPTGTTITVPGGGDLIDEGTGELVGTWGGGPATQVIGTGTGGFAGGVGVRLVFETGVIRAGRRVRGSAFIVPVLSSAYFTDGTPTSTFLNTITTGISNFNVQVAGRQRVWSRPKPATATRGALPGAAVPVSNVTCPDKVSWLRSRRV